MRDNASFKVSRNESRRKVGYISGIMKQNNVIGNVSASMTFGKANRPSTPIQGVISNNYANIAEQEVSEKYDQYLKANRDAKKNKRIVPADTRARQLAAQYLNEQKMKAEGDEKRFKMKRFNNIGPRTSTNLKQTTANYYASVDAKPAEPVDAQKENC